MKISKLDIQLDQSIVSARKDETAPAQVPLINTLIPQMNQRGSDV